MSEGYWDGATFVYRATVINGGGGGGDTSVTLEPGTGNEFDLTAGTIAHNDATASTINALIRDEDDNTQVPLIALASVAQNSLLNFPHVGAVPATGGNGPGQRRYIISGTMDLFVNAVAMDASEGSTHTLFGRIRGSVPAMTESGNSTPTITITTERTY